MNKDIHNLYSAYRMVSEGADDIRARTDELKSGAKHTMTLIDLDDHVFKAIQKQDYETLRRLRETAKQLLGASTNQELDIKLQQFKNNTTLSSLINLSTRVLGN